MSNYTIVTGFVSDIADGTRSNKLELSRAVLVWLSVSIIAMAVFYSSETVCWHVSVGYKHRLFRKATAVKQNYKISKIETPHSDTGIILAEINSFTTFEKILALC